MTGDTDDSVATRPSLLAKLKDWSQQTAWREFEHNYAPLLRNVARKAGLTDVEADEVVQESLIAVAKKIGDFEHAGNRGSFRAWLYQQARWRIADQFRARARIGPHPQPLSCRPTKEEGSQTVDRCPTEPRDVDSGEWIDRGRGDQQSLLDPAFERLWDDEWESHNRECALERLRRKVSARQFQLFDLHVLQGLSVRDAARAAGATMAAVYMAKSRVARLLRREVRRLTVEDGARD